MRRGLVGLALLAGACTGDGAAPVRVAIAPGLVFPRDLLSLISTVQLEVFDTANGVDCTTMTASSTGVPTGPSPLPKTLAETNLGTTGCAAGSKFCGNLTLAQSKTDLVFAAIGKDSNGNVAGNGCTRKTVNQEAVPVQITMVRFLPPAVCGDGMIEPGETCDPGTGTDPLCMACQTSEMQLSPASTYTGGPVAPAPSLRANPFFLWPPQSGKPGYFFAFYGDTFSGRKQISMYVLGDSLLPVTDLGTDAQHGSLFLPNDPNTFPPMGEAFDQSNPAAAIVGTNYFVAFQDDNTSGSNGIDIHLRSMDDSLTAGQTSGNPCGVNGPMGQGEAGVQSFPQLATGPGGLLLVTWQDQTSQTISGRTYTPPAPPATGCGILGQQQVISSGTSNSHGVVAAAGAGWVVAWQSGSDVKWRAISADGTPSGAEQLVGAHSGQQSLPSIASLGDGSFAIAWSAPASSGASAIFAQRFNASAMPLAGDQTSNVDNLSTGNETSPAIAGTAAAGGAYVVAWVDVGSLSDVHARLLSGTSGSLGDGSGYLFNTVSGQTDEFQVSVIAGRTRANPTVAVGGAAPYIAFGWEDRSPAGGGGQPGIIGRRFPTPTQ